MTAPARSIEYFSNLACTQLEAILLKTRMNAGGKPGGPPGPKKDAPSRTDKILTDGFRRLETGLGRVAVGLAGAGAGLASRGFSGTGVKAQFDFAMDRLAGQLAAVFTPVVQALTYGANRLTSALSRISGDQQNRLMYTSLGVLGGYALGGPGGALVGGFAGHMLGGGAGGTGSILAGAGIGALAGWRLGGPGGAAAGATAGALGGAGITDYYSAIRARGGSVAGAAFGATGLSLARIMDPVATHILNGLGEAADATGFGIAAKKFRDAAKTEIPGPDAARRWGEAASGQKSGPAARREPPPQFLPQEVGLEDIRKRIQESVMVVSSAGTPDGGPLAAYVDKILEVLGAILKAVSGGSVELVKPTVPERGRAW